jgi:hypothetical protein
LATCFAELGLFSPFADAPLNVRVAAQSLCRSFMGPTKLSPKTYSAGELYEPDPEPEESLLAVLFE